MARLLPWITAIGLFLAGCQSAEEPTTITDIAPSLLMEAQANEAAEVPDTASPATDSMAEFNPPFPARTELFAPPRGGQGTVRRDEEHGETIELKGFVDVNGPQVVLAIDGVISPIPEGGEKYGVQVISINPPQVVLQRGRSRWTASLE
jgi:hypothetical protein